LTGTELRRPILLLLRRLPFIAVLALAGAFGGYAATSASAGYVSTAVLFVGTPGTSAATFFNSETQQGQDLLALTFAAMVPAPGVVDAALTSAAVPRSPSVALAETAATAVPGTSLIRVTVTDRNPFVAEKLANSVANAFVDQIGTLDPVRSGTSGAGPTRAPVSVSQPAVANPQPQPTRRRHNTVEGGVLGLVVAIAVVLLLDNLGDRPRSAGSGAADAGPPVGTEVGKARD
jgi:capsular polysaccharide biosynthesis protein